MLENNQKKSVRSVLPFSEDLLAAIAISYLLKANSFPNNHPKWYGKLPDKQTWKSWQKFFVPLHQSLKHKTIVSTGRGNVFGTVASAV